MADTSFSSYFLDCGALYFPPCSLLAFDNKATVESVNSDQLLMSALLNDLTMIDHEYPVGISHGFQPVRDHDNRFIMGQLGDGLHQLFFIFRVYIGGCLI